MKLLEFYKKCYVCKKFLPQRLFYRNHAKLYGLSSACKECSLQYFKLRNPKRNEWEKRRRHRLGISKKYWNELGISYTKEYISRMNRLSNAKRKAAGFLSLQTIQLVYEDNIKQYGTLTCYLCLKPIKFGKDNLEHKTPLSRGGNNEYINLGVACQKCNYKKHIKTEMEYRMDNHKGG